MKDAVTGIVFDIRRYSIHDGPGIRTAVFLKGCPLACRWCHNPEGVSFKPELIFRAHRCILCNDCLGICPADAIERAGDEICIDRSLCTVNGICAASCPAEALEVVGVELDVRHVLAVVERDLTFYEQSGGGVTFTGGEPLAQPEFLLELVKVCKQHGIHTAIDTSGHAPWPVLEEMVRYVDLFMYDLKMMDEVRHVEWTGISNFDILANLRRLCEIKAHILVRIPIIPGVNDDPPNLRAAGEFLASLPTQPVVELLSYHNLHEAKLASLGRQFQLISIQTPEPEQMEKAAHCLAGFGLEVRC